MDRPSELFDGEMYLLMDHPDHEWYYLSHQKPNEVFVFVVWDSEAAEGTISGRLSTFLWNLNFVIPQQDVRS